MTSDTLFYCCSCSFYDPAFSLSLDRNHRLARTSKDTYTNCKCSKEGIPKAFSPPPSPLLALFKVSGKVNLALEIVISKNVPALCQFIYDHKLKMLHIFGITIFRC